MNIGELIKNDFLNINNKKVKKESLEEYLKSLKNAELTRFAITQVFVDKDYFKLYKVRNLNNRPKKYIIDYILENLEDILRTYIKIIRTNEIEQLKLAMNNNGKKLDFDNVMMSLHFVNFLKIFSLAKVEYNKKDGSIKIFMPEEYINIFNKCLSDKSLLAENKSNNEIFSFAEAVIDTYGIITLSELHEIFEREMFKIDVEEFEHIIASFNTYEEFYIYSDYEGETLMCNIEFDDEDYALDFYDNQKGDYKKYSKKDYLKISDGSYVKNLKSYKKFINYLDKHYEGILEDLDTIDRFVVLDYICFAQMSIEDADNAFRSNIVRLLEADSDEIEELLRLVRDIYYEYPKWKKRGNV